MDYASALKGKAKREKGKGKAKSETLRCRRLPKRLHVGDDRPDLFLRQFILLGRHLRLLAAVEYLIEDYAVRILPSAIGARQIHVLLRVRVCIRPIAFSTRAVALLTLLLEDRLAGREDLGI